MALGLTVEHVYFDPEWELADRERLRARQLERCRSLLAEVLPTNRFYRAKLGAAGCDDPRALDSWAAFAGLPFTTKAELVADQAEHPPFGTNLTYPLDRYVRLHQTSGTTGDQPLRWLDTEESWQWWARLWGHVYRGAGVGPGDRVFFAFSFGPFIGFWSAFEGARTIGALAVPGGALSSEQRVQAILDLGATVLVCTPTYALRLLEVAAQMGVDPSRSAVRATIHAGEPGASIPATRARIEAGWGARCYDHTGMTEVGATGFTCALQAGVHLVESEFIFEVLDPATGRPVPPGQPGELVITNLGRAGMPVIRYRSGDLVRLRDERCGCGRTFARLEGGILGRVDDMVVVRGVNVFPSAIEGIARQFPEVVEFRIELRRDREMDDLRVLVECAADGEAAARVAQAVERELQRRLFLRIPCVAVPPGSLPRFELKARRLVRIASPA